MKFQKQSIKVIELQSHRQLTEKSQFNTRRIKKHKRQTIKSVYNETDPNLVHKTGRKHLTLWLLYTSVESVRFNQDEV